MLRLFSHATIVELNGTLGLNCPNLKVKAVTFNKNTTTYACVMPNVETKPTWFVPTCHYCVVKGHIRLHCPGWETKHVPYEFITSHVKPKHPKIVKSSKFNHIYLSSLWCVWSH